MAAGWLQVIYVEDDEATAATLNSEDWLKTDDLCYFDSDGFLFIVDRLKELIKFKAYQVSESDMILTHKLTCDCKRHLTTTECLSYVKFWTNCRFLQPR